MSYIEENKPHSKLRTYAVWIALTLIMLAAAVIRLRLIDVPLERDEGEFAYAGQLILEGIPPYAQAYNMKLPGIYAAYAGILAVFGQTQNGIHLGLLCINAATILILFLLTRKLFGSTAGLAAAAAFAILSISSSVQGIFANAEHFVILPACAGLLMMVYANQRNKLWMLFAGGLLLGIGFLMKQHGVMFVAFGGIYLLISEITNRSPRTKLISRCLLYVFAASLPFIVTCAILAKAGVFDKFWFWTFTYASQYVSSIPFAAGIKGLGAFIATGTAPSRLIWITGIIGLLCLILGKKNKQHAGFALGFTLFSFLAICPGFYFRPHYFMLLLPAWSMLAGIAISSTFGWFGKSHNIMIARVLPVLLAVIIIGESFYKQSDYLFTQSPLAVARSVYGANPFGESLKIAEYIKENSDASDRIAVIGSEPQIYFYSDLRSATGHIYTYALMESHPYALKMQEEMIREIEETAPEFIVFVNVRASWLVRPNSDKTIFQWFDRYISNYKCVGVIDILSPTHTYYAWDQRANYTPRASNWLKVYRKTNSQ